MVSHQKCAIRTKDGKSRLVVVFGEKAGHLQMKSSLAKLKLKPSWAKTLLSKPSQAKPSQAGGPGNVIILILIFIHHFSSCSP